MSKKDKDKNKQKILNVIPIFLAKTYRIVDNPAHKNIVEWTPEGNGFVIKNVTQLIQKIFPKYFKHGNFPSFVRQLNLYGFRKVRSIQQKQIFSHDFFHRDHPESLSLIKRKNSQNQTQIQPSQTQQANLAANQQQQMPEEQSNLQINQNSLAMLPAKKANHANFSNIPMNISKQTQLQGELINISEKHQGLQNLVSILVEQNKQIIMQNKNFISKIGKMDDNYRKKLQTLIFLMVFGLKNGESNIIVPQQLSNMIRAFTSKKKQKRSKSANNHGNKTQNSNNSNANNSTNNNNSAVQLFKKTGQQGRFNNKNIEQILQMLELESGGHDEPSISIPESDKKQQMFEIDQPSPIPSLRSFPSYMERQQKDDWQDLLRSIDHADLLDYEDKL